LKGLQSAEQNIVGLCLHLFAVHHTELWSAMYSSLMFWQVAIVSFIRSSETVLSDGKYSLCLEEKHQLFSEALSLPNTSYIYLCALSPTCIHRHWTRVLEERDGETDTASEIVWVCIPSSVLVKSGFFGMRVIR